MRNTFEQRIALELLGQLLSAIPSAKVDFDTEGAAVRAELELPSGDVYRVSVEWDSERSP